MKVPQHTKVYETLSGRILAGAYGPGVKLPSEQELTREFAVSRITVMRALNDLAHDGLIWRKQGAGSFVKITKEKQCCLGLMIPGIGIQSDGSMFPFVQKQIISNASRLDWKVLLGDLELPSQADASGRQPVEVARRLIQHGVSAVAFGPFGINPRGDAYNRNVLAEFRSANVPVVLLGGDIVNYPDRSDYDVIGLDDAHAGFLMGQHLLQRGCRNIAFVGMALRFPARALRFGGVQKAVERVPGAKCSEWSLQSGENEAKAIVGAIRKGKCDAVIGENDEIAVLVMKHLKAAGVAVGTEIKVGGFDNAPIASAAPVPMTSVAQPAEEFADEVISAIRDRLANPSLPGRWIRLHGRLVIRESTRGTPETKEEKTRPE